MKDIANDFHIGKREDPVQRERAAPRAPGGLEDGAGPHGEGHSGCRLSRINLCTRIVILQRAKASSDFNLWFCFFGIISG